MKSIQFAPKYGFYCCMSLHLCSCLVCLHHMMGLHMSPTHDENGFVLEMYHLVQNQSQPDSSLVVCVLFVLVM